MRKSDSQSDADLESSGHDEPASLTSLMLPSRSVLRLRL